MEVNDDGSSIIKNVGREAFNDAFAKCPVVQYTRNGAVSYLSPDDRSSGRLDAYSVFTDSWVSNLLDTDFKLYSSHNDMIDDIGAWTL